MQNTNTQIRTDIFVCITENMYVIYGYFPSLFYDIYIFFTSKNSEVYNMHFPFTRNIMQILKNSSEFKL